MTMTRLSRHIHGSALCCTEGSAPDTLASALHTLIFGYPTARRQSHWSESGVGLWQLVKIYRDLLPIRSHEVTAGAAAMKVIGIDLYKDNGMTGMWDLDMYLQGVSFA